MSLYKFERLPASLMPEYRSKRYIDCLIRTTEDINVLLVESDVQKSENPITNRSRRAQNTGNYVLVTPGCPLPRFSSLTGTCGPGLLSLSLSRPQERYLQWT